MSALVRSSAPWRRLQRDDSGSAAVETALAAALALGMSVAAADLGSVLRGQARLEAAVGDAARMLALTPEGPDGVLLEGGVRRARAALQARLREGGLAPAPLSRRPAGAVCDARGAVCHRLDPVQGAGAALGAPRRVVRLWAGAAAPTRVMGAALEAPDAPPDEAGRAAAPRAALLAAAQNRAHAP
jgi:Flp pilus assembly pilin Flp